MNETLKEAIESAVPGLDIDGKVEVSEAVAVAQKLLEVAVVAKDAVVVDGKVTTVEVVGVVKAVAAVAPKEFWKAVFDQAEKEIKESPTKWDDVFLPVVKAMRGIFGAK
jgi:hypothetical protein